MSFEGSIKSATAMNERLTKARTSGVLDDASQRVSGEELQTFETGVLAAIHGTFGKGSVEDKEWAAVLKQKDQYVANAIKAKPGIGAYDGYIDYFNLAIAKLNSFDAARAREPKTPWEHVTGFVRKLPPRARKWALGICIGASVLGGGWGVAPEPVRTAIISTVYSPAPILSISLITAEQRTSIAKSFEIDETNSTHEVTGTNVKRYERRFGADPGYAITKVTIDKKSATRVEDLTSNIDHGGASVAITFGLEAGPAVDRYRGWLKATVNTTQERVIPAQTIEVVRGWPAKKGQQYQRAGAVAATSMVELRDDKGTLVATGALGRPLEVGKTTIVVDRDEVGVTILAR
jgi:hypothetical protein